MMSNAKQELVRSTGGGIMRSSLAAALREQTPLPKFVYLARRNRIQGKFNYAHLDTFHRAIKPYIFISHIFGLMPLANTLNANPYRLQFRCQTFAMVFSAIFLISGSLKTLHYTRAMLATGINAKNCVGLVFFYITMSIAICFFSLARRWPNLLDYWTRVDLIFLLPPYNRENNVQHEHKLKRKLRKLALILGAIAVADHILYHASQYYNLYMIDKHCHPNDTQINYHTYVERQYQEIFAYVSYNTFFGLYALFFNAQFTFVWNYLDFFLMMVSLSLATRFQKLAEHVELLKYRYVPDAVWYAIRQDHVQLSELVELINKHLSDFVLLSCLNNTYFICNQLLNIFTKLRWPISYVYFWYSLSFLLLRTVSVFMCAAEINDASMLPLKTLYLIPSGCWTMEVQRFTAQIKQDNIGLSGKRFYLITRKNLFGLAAAILTYEFMLLQFDASSRKAGLPGLCD